MEESTSNRDLILSAFEEQANACEHLGSPFTASLCRAFEKHLDDTTAIGRLCLNWSGNPSNKADSLALRLCGGMQALALSGRDHKLAIVYGADPMVVPDWSIIEAALITHELFLTDWMKSPPQTNEVSRSAVLWPAMMALSKRYGKSLRLLEVGASAGLNLRLNHFSYKLDGHDCGAQTSALYIEPEWRGDQPEISDVVISSSAGCDLNPLDPTDEHDALRLRSYCWADQRDRKKRLDAAIDIATTYPVIVDRMDAINWLKDKLAATAPDNETTIIYSTVAWQYLPEADQAAGEAIIREAGKQASTKSPLCWLRFESDGKGPGGQVKLNTWPGNHDKDLGRADFHGRWIDWKTSERDADLSSP